MGFPPKARQKISSCQRDRLSSIGYDWQTIGVHQEEVWFKMYGRLQQYHEKEGNTNIPQNYPPNCKLGVWVVNQRKMEKMGKLKPERKEMLDSIEFQWSLKPRKTRRPVARGRGKHDAKWNNMFKLLKKYKQEHGDCHVPYSYPENRSLGMWVSAQRHEFAQKSWCGTARKIREDRREQLESIGFSWSRVQKKKPQGS